MEEFKQRLLDEKKQLDEKREKLKSFFDSEKANSIDRIQVSLLKIQLNAMNTYSSILGERIQLLDVPAVTAA